MARKWSNRNLPGALHFATGNFLDRVPAFTRAAACQAYIDVIANKRPEWPFKLVAYVLMPDHFHLIVNPRDGCIRELMGALKSLSAQAIVHAVPDLSFRLDQPKPNQSEHQVWQESFKDLSLWSDWMIWQKINYIHFNPVKAGLVKSAGDYHWSSFRSFYLLDKDVPIEVDREWWWPEDVKKLAVAAKQWSKEMENQTKNEGSV
jgi:putative transposase